MEQLKEQLKEKYHQYQFLIWPLCSGLASIIILVFVVIPQLLNYFHIKSEIFSLDTRVNTLEAKASELLNIDDEKNRRDLVLAFNLLPPEGDVPQIFVLLQGILNQSGVILKNISFNTSSGASATTEESFKVHLAVSGTLPLIKNFLVKIGEAPMIFQIEAINANFQSAEVEAEFPLKVYFKKIDTLSAPLEAQLPQITDEEELLLKRGENHLFPSGEGTEDTSSVLLGKTNPFE